MTYEPNESYLDRITRLKSGASMGTISPTGGMTAHTTSTAPVASPTQPPAGQTWDSWMTGRSPSMFPSSGMATAQSGGLQIEGGGIQGLPTINKDWVSWNEATPAQYSVGSDTDAPRLIQHASDAGYGFNWGMNNPIGDFYTNTNNYEWAFDPTTGAPSLRVKSGDKTGTTVKYVQDATGNWVPDYSQASTNSWDTNQNDEFYKGIGTVAGAAIGGNLAAASGLLGGAAQGAWQGGLTGAGAAGAGGAASTAGLTELGLGGAGYTGSVAPVAGASSLTALPGAGAATSASTLSQIAEYAKQGMSFVEAAQRVLGAGGGSAAGQGGGASIIDMLGAYYSAQQMKDLSGNQKEMYSTQRGIQQPYLEQLLASYKDPNSFYGSNQWKGLESVYQNSIDRQAAQKGRLANPTDREVLLNNYAMKELENYRSGLRGAVQATDPAKYAEIYGKGLENEAFANTAPWATASRGGTGTLQTINDTWKTVKDVGSTAEDIWKFIEGWFD